MASSLANIWRLDGKLDRGKYALWGLLAFAVKFNLDRVVAFGFGRKWNIQNYWVSSVQALNIFSVTRKDAAFLATMLALSLPFIWLGVVLTLRRLRAADLPPWLVIFFFFPFLNLLFFALLCVVPSKEEPRRTAFPRESDRPAFLARIIPDHPVGSAAMSLLLTLFFGVVLSAFGTTFLQAYGWGLFVAMPFCMGVGSALLYGYHQPRGLGSCLMVALVSVALLGGALMAVAIEGLICIVMAAPIGGILALLGGWIGYLIQRRPEAAAHAPAMLILIVLTVPALMGVEAARPSRSFGTAPLFRVDTNMEVDAPPEVVWQRVVSFTQLPEPEDWLFRAGIAYPIRAEIEGQGAGAVRHCVFSTGSFVEPIEVWDAPRLLKFAVTSNPAPMQEWTPYRAVHPAHLDGFLVSRGGQFHLVPLPGGRTRIEASTWYQHHMWPAAYWQLWSDAVIHRIHTRVLKHVKSLAEEELKR